jgi:hypothetical protein
VFDSLYLAQIHVNGAAAVVDQNIRVDQYLQGSVVIGQPSTYQPLEIFPQPNLAGTSLKLGIYTYYRSANLGTMDKATRSFRLKRGYMATFAQNQDGTGLSRVYVADRGDLAIDTLPKGLSGAVSFVRVFPWRWTARKGWTNGVPAANALKASWWYDWDNAAASTPNLEYVPMRHDMNWNAYSNINGKLKVTHALGLNEPDNASQANVSVAVALSAWPLMLNSGLRLGSPAPSDAYAGTLWIEDFMHKADSLHYRVDFVPVHWYKGGQTAQQFHDWLQGLYNQVHRPIWITEWNNGANWTCCIPTYAQEAQTIGEMIRMLDTTSFVERYSIYEWLDSTQQMFLVNPTKLTQAGGVYRDDISTMAYNPDFARVAYGECVGTQILPNVQYPGQAWQSSYFAVVNQGGAVNFGPWPWTGGSWQWKGPAGFTSTSREIDLTNLQPAQAGKYEADYTDPTGCRSSQIFELTVMADSSTGIRPSGPRSARASALVRGHMLEIDAGSDPGWSVSINDINGARLLSLPVQGRMNLDLGPWAAHGCLLVRVSKGSDVLYEGKTIVFRP